MISILFLFGSGAAYFVGAGLILAGVALAVLSRGRRVLNSIATLTAIAGMILLVLSAVPQPVWLYAVAAGVTVIWIVAERSSRVAIRRRVWARGAVVATLLLMVGLELPFLFAPRVDRWSAPPLYVIGDSVSAGTGEGEVPWPDVLARTRQVEVVNLAQMGATVASASRQAEALPAEGGIVLLEIGGNDLLGPTSAAQFETGLETLLRRVTRPGRTVLMFELPLPPLRNTFGRIQRRLAARHGVPLIPRHVFMATLTSDAATLDSVHLTERGHARLAETVWLIIRPAFAAGEKRP